MVEHLLKLQISEAMSSSNSKVLVVAGGGSGIGQATVLEFARRNYNVAILGRTRNKLDITADMCRAEGLTDKHILPVVCDITKPEQNDAAIAEIVQTYGRIDILVNSTGYAHYIPFAEHTLAMLDDMYYVHIRGFFDLAQKVMPHLLKTKGNIVNVSSAAATLPWTQAISNSMMKACSDHFIRALSVDYAPKGVRINSVNPGYTRTNAMDHRGTPEEVQEIWENCAKSMPIGKMIQPTDMAKTIAFLASDAASFITGANIPVDGAWRNTMALPK